MALAQPGVQDATLALISACLHTPISLNHSAMHAWRHSPSHSWLSAHPKAPAMFCPTTAPLDEKPSFAAASPAQLCSPPRRLAHRTKSPLLVLQALMPRLVSALLASPEQNL